MVRIIENKIVVERTRATLEDLGIFEKAVDNLVAKGFGEIQIDFSATLNLPSEFLGYLMGKKKALMKDGKNLRIVAISEQLRRLFNEARISELMDV